MSDDKPSDRAIAQAFMHEVWNTQVKDGDASRLINRVLHYAREIDAQQPKDKSAERQPTFDELQSWALANGHSGETDQQAYDAWLAAHPPARLKDDSAQPVAYLAIGKYARYLVFGELIFGLPTNRVESGKALRGKYESYLVFRADF